MYTSTSEILNYKRKEISKMIKIIKRNGNEVEFDKQKIINAINKANEEVAENDKCIFTHVIADDVEKICEKSHHYLSVEDIQDIVENELIELNCTILAKKYITYRYKRSLIRMENNTDKPILSIINGDNEVIKQENSNKNCFINSTQRDYMAGEVSKDITRRLLLPQNVVDAHDKGIIHFHDMDYFANHMTNCCLINLEDMLQNGTVISENMIEKPKSFSTACNVATQIIAQVASQQYGGQTITLSHLVPFVDISRQKYIKKVREEFEAEFDHVDEDRVKRIAEKRLKKEVKAGIQTIQYQILTLLTTNGQTPFITVFMYLNEVEEKYKEDLALIIKETLEQRILGVKNKVGHYFTPAFPKLIYVLEEDNITEDSKYWYLTELAAKCTAKRMVPDYISEKKMLSLKIDKNGNGNCYPCINIPVPNISDNIRKLA